MSKGEDESPEQLLLVQTKLFLEGRREFINSMQMVAGVLSSLNEETKSFRGFLQTALTSMHVDCDDAAIAKANLLVEAQEKFVDSATMVCDVTIGLNERVKHYDDIFKGQLEMIEAHNNESRKILDMFPTLFRDFAEVNESIKANTQMMAKIVDRLDRYLGSDSGLEYDN